MDTKTIIAKLNTVFCEMKKAGKTYSEVWLEYEDFGGLYTASGKYILNVKAHHRIDNCNTEIRDIVFLLNEKAFEVYPYIWRVVVYNADAQIHCQSVELKVFEEENSCN